MDVRFENALPDLFTSLRCELSPDRWITTVVQGHLDRSTVRTIAIEPTRALRRGSRVECDGRPLTRAHETVERERDSIKRGLAHLERAQVERLSAAVAAATRESVARLLTTLNAPDLDASLAQAACRQLEGLQDSALGPVLIESARPLADSAHAAIVAALNAHARSAEFRVVPDLGAGLRITTGHGLIDASALGLARQAEGLVRDALAAESFEVTT